MLCFGQQALEIEQEDGRVVAVRTDKGRIPCGTAVLATGVMGNALLAPLGVHVPMEPRAVTLLRTVPGARVLDQVIGVADASCAGRQERGRPVPLQPARTNPFPQPLAFEQGDAPGKRHPGPALRPRVGDVAHVAALFGALVPAALEAALDEAWVGLIDSTPDALPVIERSEQVRGLVLGMGFSGHGFCLGPVTGRILSALARDETPNLPIAPFALGRFAGGVGATRPRSRCTDSGGASLHRSPVGSERGVARAGVDDRLRACCTSRRAARSRQFALVPGMSPGARWPQIAHADGARPAAAAPIPGNGSGTSRSPATGAIPTAIPDTRPRRSSRRASAARRFELMVLGDLLLAVLTGT